MPIDDCAITSTITRHKFRLIATRSMLDHLNGRCLIVATRKRGSTCLRATREAILRHDCERDFGDSLLVYLQANLIAFGWGFLVSQSTAIHPIRLAVAKRRSHPSRRERLTGSECASSHCLHGVAQGGDSCKDHPVQHGHDLGDFLSLMGLHDLLPYLICCCSEHAWPTTLRGPSQTISGG